MYVVIKLILRFIVHVLAIYLGARVAGVEADFGRSAITALVGYVAMFLVGLLLWPLNFVPLMSLLVDSAVLLIGTAIAARLVMSADWGKAFTISAVAAVVQFAAGMLLGSAIRP